MESIQTHWGDQLKLATLSAECSVIIKCLDFYKWNRSKAARALDIDRKTLYNKLAAFEKAGLFT